MRFVVGMRAVCRSAAHGQVSDRLSHGRRPSFDLLTLPASLNSQNTRFNITMLARNALIALPTWLSRIYFARPKATDTVSIYVSTTFTIPNIKIKFRQKVQMPSWLSYWLRGAFVVQQSHMINKNGETPRP
jgi:hypothetical protein